MLIDAILARINSIFFDTSEEFLEEVDLEPEEPIEHESSRRVVFGARRGPFGVGDATIGAGDDLDLKTYFDLGIWDEN